MRPSLFLGLLFVLTVACNVYGQALLVPRRHSTDNQFKPNQASTGTADAPGTTQSSQRTGAVTPRQELASPPATPLPAALPVAANHLNIRIPGQVATVTVAHLFSDDTGDLLEGTYYFRVPEKSSLEEFAVYDGEERRVGRVKEKEQARADYAAAVGQSQDPAILEMTKSGWFQSHVYPILHHSAKWVQIIY